MFTLSGKCADPIVLIHGGAGPQDPKAETTKIASQKLIDIATKAALLLAPEADLSDNLAVIEAALSAMENDATFNAGYGSALQADGSQRLTAAMMDGEKQTFSGVISLSHVKNPSVLARYLQTQSSRVLTAPGHELLARKLQLEPETLLTETRIQRWLTYLKEGRKDNLLFDSDCDTVGCVVRNGLSALASGTSTGGRGGEIPGRVSDSATVAGNYASRFGAISCTGIGEQIVDDAVAARLETRCRDGMNIVMASQKCFEEAQAGDRSYGWIGVDHEGHWVAFTTTQMMTFAVVSATGKVLASSLELCQ